MVQIAGLIARRILCDVREGDAVHAGTRFGMIRFGSRTDLYLPEGVRPLVAEGQTMIGGETVRRRAGRAPEGGRVSEPVSPLRRLRAPLRLAGAPGRASRGRRSTGSSRI